jgi:hypothetical protein
VSQSIEEHLDSEHPVSSTVSGHWWLRQLEYDL